MKTLKIKEYRKLNGYKQEDIAKLLSVTQSAYSRKENGKRGFTLNEITILKDIFKVTYDDLLS